MEAFVAGLVFGLVFGFVVCMNRIHSLEDQVAHLRTRCMLNRVKGK